jgi:hypothetical protein
MDLPVLHDNLRSSSGWLADLERALPGWQPDLYSHVRELIPETDRNAFDFVEQQTHTPGGNVSVEWLLAINSALTGQQATLRTGDLEPIVTGHDPVPAIILPKILDNALDWFRTQSFNEIHPVEQAALVLLRLCDLQPFPSHNLDSAVIASSFYTMRAGLPPVVLPVGDELRPRFDAALEAAFRMLTQPLVEAIAENLTQTIRMVTR